jgi:tetratricopeptide (TPR) repeat protein
MIRAVRCLGSFVVALCLTVMIPAQVRAWATPLSSEDRAALRRLARGQGQTPHPTDAVMAARQALVQRLLAAETDAHRSALLEADKSLLTIELARLLIEQGVELLRQQNFHKALPILRPAVQITERVGDKSVMASVLIIIGNAYRGQRMVDEALGAYRQALALWESLNNQAGIATAQVLIGVITAQYGNLPLSLEYLQKGLAIFERLNDRPRMAETNYFIGEIHRLQRRFDSALEVYHKALSLHETLNNKIGMVQTLNGIRLTHTAQGKDDLARVAQQKILTLNEEMRSAGQGSAARQALVRLLAAETDAQRSALLEADRSLLTGDLARSLSAGVSELMQQHDYSKA